MRAASACHGGFAPVVGSRGVGVRQFGQARRRGRHPPTSSAPQQRLGQAREKDRSFASPGRSTARRHRPMPSMTPGWVRSGKTPARASAALAAAAHAGDHHERAARRRPAAQGVEHARRAARARPAKSSRCSKSKRSNPRKGLPRVQLGPAGLVLAQPAHDHRPQVTLEVFLELAGALEGVECAGERALLRVAEKFRGEERFDAPPFLDGLEELVGVGDAGAGRFGGLAVNEDIGHTLGMGAAAVDGVVELEKRAGGRFGVAVGLEAAVQPVAEAAPEQQDDDVGLRGQGIWS